MSERCTGTADAVGGGQVWMCEQDDATGGLDRTVYRVAIVAVGSGDLEIVATVDQTRDSVIDVNRTRGFLADAIAGSPPAGTAGPELTDWVVGMLERGGRTRVGRVDAILSPFGWVTELRLTIRVAVVTASTVPRPWRDHSRVVSPA